MRLVGDGALEHFAVFNTAPESIAVELRLACGADFADLFEVRDSVRNRSANIACHSGGRSLRFRYRVPGFLAETTIEVERSEIVEAATERVLGPALPRIEGSEIAWEVELPARCALMALVRVGVRVNEVSFTPAAKSFEAPQVPGDGSRTGWLERIPAFDSGSDLLNSVFRQSVLDLAALRISGDLLGEHYVLPAAGLPWFMTLFGRDTLITSLQTLWVGAGLARGALHLLGALQGTQVDDFRDEEPGKIMHEVRSGELTLLGEKPHSPYYGTADATPLWLILLSEYWRFTGDDAFVRARWHNVLAALAWIDRYGDRDGDGYVEYATRSSQGLGNQCWKDSWDGVQFADGTIPHLPIATAEIQGYVYDAKLRIAELARRLALGDGLAQRLENEAASLRARFNQDFWSEERGGFYVVGLDGDKRRDRLADLEHRASALVGDRPRRTSATRRRSPSLRPALLGLGRPHPLQRRPRLQPHRLPRRHDLAARQLDPRARARPKRLPRCGQSDRARATRSGLVHRPSPSRGVRGLRALDQPLPGALPDRLQPTGLGERSAVRLHPGTTRPRGP